MAEKSCIKRLQKEYRAICKIGNLMMWILEDVVHKIQGRHDLPVYRQLRKCVYIFWLLFASSEPVSHVVARPSPNDILEWHYVLEGSEGTPFAGGYYYGKIKFPPEYPYKPPGISMTTPNGRFMTQKKICLSMSDFHPESWNPMWSVSSILTGLLSFMMDNSPTTGSVNTTTDEKQRLAKASLAFNCKNATFRKLFPEYVEKYNEQQQQQLSQKVASERVSLETSHDESSRPLSQKVLDSTREDMKRVDGLKDVRKNRKKQSFPTWMMLLLFSIFGVVMALPLLQL